MAVIVHLKLTVTAFENIKRAVETIEHNIDVISKGDQTIAINLDFMCEEARRSLDLPKRENK